VIITPTVLVLGAGASNPYGYPTGKELKRIIIDHITSSSSRMHNVLSYQAIDDKKIVAFRKAFLRSGQVSIDAFLEHQPQFTELGKLVITAVLAEKENTDGMFLEGNWYEHLFRALDNGTIEDFGKNKLSIITFNYDRSIETFLFNALKYSYEKRDEDVAIILNQIPIIHLNGQVGSLPWQDPLNNRPYGEHKNNYLIKQSSEGIKIIHETEAETTDIFIKARQLMNDAQRIYFFGFGYHSENIRKLGIKKISTDDKTILGTCLHMTDKEATAKMIDCNNKINLKRNGSQTFSILQFIRENISFSS
jgi:hypothetical protein